MSKSNTPEKPLSKLAERIETIGDQLKVRAHLATMEAKDAWDRVHLERINDEISTLRDEAKVQMHLASLDAKDAWSKIEKRFGELRGQAATRADHLFHDIGDGMGKVARALRGHAGDKAETTA